MINWLLLTALFLVPAFGVAAAENTVILPNREQFVTPHF